jgi:antitoxin (DNA-binding transcriptional repressor) of toxin-antitoxin stability system
MHEAKTRLSELVTLVEKNNEIVRVCRNGAPVAELILVSGVVDPLKQNPAIKDIKILCDPTATLDSDEWPEGWHASG